MHIDLMCVIPPQSLQTIFFKSYQTKVCNCFCRILTQKVRDNLAVLLDCEDASLFLVDDRRSAAGSSSSGGGGGGGGGGKDKPPLLVSKVFDVHCGVHLLPGASQEDEIIVPWGTGI